MTTRATVLTVSILMGLGGCAVDAGSGDGQMPPIANLPRVDVPSGSLGKADHLGRGGVRGCVELLRIDGLNKTATLHTFVGSRRVSRRFVLLDASYPQARPYETIENHLERWWYDAKGLVARYTRDGKQTSASSRVRYDRAGRPLELTSSARFGGGSTTWRYDGAGRLVARTQTYGSSGSVAETRVVFDAAGRKISEEQRFAGKLSRRTSWLHGAHGVTRESVEAGRRREQTDFAYDAAGKLASSAKHEDFYGKGAWDRVTTTTIDGVGRATRVEVDHPFDGVVDTRLETSYDGASERKASERKIWLTAEGGARVQWDYSWRYDAAGREIEKRTGVAQWASVQVERRSYSAGGKIATITVRDGQGALLRQTVHHYDASGRETRVEHDSDGSGLVLQRRKVYGSAGQLVLDENRGFVLGGASAQTFYSDGCFADIARANAEVAKFSETIR